MNIKSAEIIKMDNQEASAQPLITYIRIQWLLKYICTYIYMHLCWYTPHALASKQSKMLLSVPAVPIRLHKSLYIYICIGSCIRVHAPTYIYRYSHKYMHTCWLCKCRANDISAGLLCSQHVYTLFFCLPSQPVYLRLCKFSCTFDTSSALFTINTSCTGCVSYCCYCSLLSTCSYNCEVLVCVCELYVLCSELTCCHLEVLRTPLPLPFPLLQAALLPFLYILCYFCILLLIERQQLSLPLSAAFCVSYRAYVQPYLCNKIKCIPNSCTHTYN